MINYIPYTQSENLCTGYKYVDKVWIRFYFLTFLFYTSPLCHERIILRKESEAKHTDFFHVKVLQVVKTPSNEDEQKVENA